MEYKNSGTVLPSREGDDGFLIQIYLAYVFTGLECSSVEGYEAYEGKDQLEALDGQLHSAEDQLKPQYVGLQKSHA